jgi:hypothetical protein
MRLKRLKRLAALYGVVERMHSIELQMTTAAVREAEQAIEEQQVVMRSAGFDQRDALMNEDRLGWLLAERQREIAGWRRERLERICVEREALSAAAQEQYSASRLKSEQMKGVVDGVAARVQVEEGRRTQGAADDRFLSRRSWMEAQDEDRRESYMNDS